MSPMTAQDFERRYRRDQDPWRYRQSRYERRKYAATLEGCGRGPFRNALELGASIGVFSLQLAPRCESLTTIDFAPTAVRLAKSELAPYPHARAIQGRIPDDLPAGPYDLVLASEVLYYLDRDALGRTLDALERELSPAGRLVCVHWRRTGTDRPLSADQVHETIRALSWLKPLPRTPAGEYLLDVFERR
jgi:SAM-dependent methyltransferase